MTYRELINSIDDEFAKWRVMAEIARKYPEYEDMPKYKRHKFVQEILDTEIEEEQST